MNYLVVIRASIKLTSKTLEKTPVFLRNTSVINIDDNLQTYECRNYLSKITKLDSNIIYINEVRSGYKVNNIYDYNFDHTLIDKETDIIVFDFTRLSRTREFFDHLKTVKYFKRIHVILENKILDIDSAEYDKEVDYCIYNSNILHKKILRSLEMRKTRGDDFGKPKNFETINRLENNAVAYRIDDNTYNITKQLYPTIINFETEIKYKLNKLSRNKLIEILIKINFGSYNNASFIKSSKNLFNEMVKRDIKIDTNTSLINYSSNNITKEDDVIYKLFEANKNNKILIDKFLPCIKSNDDLMQFVLCARQIKVQEKPDRFNRNYKIITSTGCNYNKMTGQNHNEIVTNLLDLNPFNNLSIISQEDLDAVIDIETDLLSP